MDAYSLYPPGPVPWLLHHDPDVDGVSPCTWEPRTFPASPDADPDIRRFQLERVLADFQSDTGAHVRVTQSGVCKFTTVVTLQGRRAAGTYTQERLALRAIHTLGEEVGRGR